MRKIVRRIGPGSALCIVGAILALAGTGASLGLAALAAPEPAPVAPAAHGSAPAGGLELTATVGADVPLLPLDPVTIEASPDALAAAPLPGASVDREVGVDKLGLGLAADLDLAAGSHRARGDAGEVGLAGAAMRAVAAPEVAPAAAAAAAAFTLAGVVAYFWPTIKTWAGRLALAPALALYAKITRAEVFDNGVRERIFTAIREHPGRSASDLARLADVSWGTTIYHLDVLEQTRMVSSIRNGRYRRYFENGAPLTVSKDVVAVLQNPVTAGVADTVRRVPGATQKELAAATNMTPQALHWHLTRLVATGVVRKEREGRVVRHFLAS